MLRLVLALLAFGVAVAASTVWTLQQLRRAPARTRWATAGVAVAGYAVAVGAMVL